MTSMSRVHMKKCRELEPILVASICGGRDVRWLQRGRFFLLKWLTIQDMSELLDVE